MVVRKVLNRSDVWWFGKYERLKEWSKENPGGRTLGFDGARVASKVKSRKP
jgi:hypothetical protein